MSYSKGTVYMYDEFGDYVAQFKSASAVKTYLGVGAGSVFAAINYNNCIRDTIYLSRIKYDTYPIVNTYRFIITYFRRIVS